MGFTEFAFLVSLERASNALYMIYGVNSTSVDSFFHNSNVKITRDRELVPARYRTYSNFSNRTIVIILIYNDNNIIISLLIL